MEEKLTTMLPSDPTIREQVYSEFLKFALHMHKEEGRARLQDISPDDMMIGVSFPFLSQILAFAMAYGETIDKFNFATAANNLVLMSMDDKDPRN